jgi:hypothetical protein
MKQLQTRMLLIMLLIFTSNSFAGPVGGGGGVLLTDQDISIDWNSVNGKDIILDIDNISDIRLKSEDIVDFKSLIDSQKATNSYKLLKNKKAIFDLSNGSNILDIQLNTGDILRGEDIMFSSKNTGFRAMLSGPGLGGGSLSSFGN